MTDAMNRRANARSAARRAAMERELHKSNEPGGVAHRLDWAPLWAESSHKLTVAGVAPNDPVWEMLRKSGVEKRMEDRAMQAIAMAVGMNAKTFWIGVYAAHAAMRPDAPSRYPAPSSQLAAAGGRLRHPLSEIDPRALVYALQVMVPIEGTTRVAVMGEAELVELEAGEGEMVDALISAGEALLLLTGETLGIGGKWGLMGEGMVRVPCFAGIKGKGAHIAEAWDVALNTATRTMFQVWHSAQRDLRPELEHGRPVLRPLISHVDEEEFPALVAGEMYESYTGLALMSQRVASRFGIGSSTYEVAILDLREEGNGGESTLPPAWMAVIAYHALMALLEREGEDGFQLKLPGTNGLSLRVELADLAGWVQLLKRALDLRGVYEGIWGARPAIGQVGSEGEAQTMIRKLLAGSDRTATWRAKPIPWTPPSIPSNEDAIDG